LALAYSEAVVSAIDFSFSFDSEPIQTKMLV